MWGPVKARRALAERLGARGWPSGVLSGPQAEPGTSLPAAAAQPRLRLGSQRGSAWGAAAAGSAGPSSEAAERGAWSPGSAGAPRPSRSLAAPGFLPSSRRLLGRLLPHARSQRPEDQRKSSDISSGARAPGSPALPARAARARSCVPRGGRHCSAREPPDAGERRRRRASPALGARPLPCSPPPPGSQPTERPPCSHQTPTLFFLGSSKFKASSLVLQTHPAFPRPQEFSGTSISGDLEKRKPPLASPDSPGGLDPQTHWAFSPRLLTVVYSLLQTPPVYTPPSRYPLQFQH